MVKGLPFLQIILYPPLLPALAGLASGKRWKAGSPWDIFVIFPLKKIPKVVSLCCIHVLNNNLFQEDPVFQTLPDFQPKWAQLHLRFAPKFQGQKTNAGEEGVETPNLGSWAAGGVGPFFQTEMVFNDGLMLVEWCFLMVFWWWLNGHIIRFFMDLAPGNVAGKSHNFLRWLSYQNFRFEDFPATFDYHTGYASGSGKLGATPGRPRPEKPISRWASWKMETWLLACGHNPSEKKLLSLRSVPFPSFLRLFFFQTISWAHLTAMGRVPGCQTASLLVASTPQKLLGTMIKSKHL